MEGFKITDKVKKDWKDGTYKLQDVYFSKPNYNQSHTIANEYQLFVNPAPMKKQRKWKHGLCIVVNKRYDLSIDFCGKRINLIYKPSTILWWIKKLTTTPTL